MNSIQQMVLEFAEKVMDPQILQHGLSEALSTYQEQVDALARQLFAALIGLIDQALADDRHGREGWKVVQKGVSRTLQSTYGPLRFERRYYRHPEKGYAYLCHEVLDIAPYERIERGLALALVKDATEVSYHQSAKRGRNQPDQRHESGAEDESSPGDVAGANRCCTRGAYPGGRRPCSFAAR